VQNPAATFADVFERPQIEHHWRAVIRRRQGMALEAWSDERIRNEALEKIRNTARVPLEHIGVMVSNGRVILRGKVASPVKRWAAGEAVLRVPGVVTVLNDLVYQRPQRGRPAQWSRSSNR
jgi:osmotically-inducible protein OsmY